MRRACIFLLFLSPVLGRADAPPLLHDAIQKLIADDDHWAYTESTQRFDRLGKPEGGPTVERYDPSQPTDREWQLLQYRGHAPSRWELSSWQSQKEKTMKHHGEKTLGDVLDMDHAMLASETGTVATFLVPIMKEASKRFPADKLEVFMQVDKTSRALTSFSLRPKAPFRIAGLMKVESGEVDGRLEVVQAKYAPTLVWARGSGAARILGFIPYGMGAEVNYTAFHRVQPYNDRFEVKIGDLKALNF
jgi:hypothetical protein